MSRLATSFVLGYHGCDLKIATRAIAGDISLIQSNTDFDWLGPGAYFWESDRKRALEWAQWNVSRGRYETPAVIGAVIDLRNCLDLVSREHIELVRDAYEGFVAVRKKAGLPLPQNRNVKGAPDEDRLLRYLDCAVIKHLHAVIRDNATAESAIQPFDTVRGMFAEAGTDLSRVRLLGKEPRSNRGSKRRLYFGCFQPTLTLFRRLRRAFDPG